VPTELTPATLAVGFLVCVVLVVLAAWLLQRRGSATGTRDGVPAEVELRWTRHVRERMEQRQVSGEAVEQTLRHPQNRLFDADENSWRFERVFAGRDVDVRVTVWVSAEVWPPRDEVVVKSTAAQRIAQMRVPRAAVGRVIGRGGSTVTRIRRETGARVDVGKEGAVEITADTVEQMARARALVKAAAR